MNSIITVPADGLRGLGVRQGDLLRVLSSEGDQFRIEIQRADHEDCQSQLDQDQGTSRIQQWLKSARGRVTLAQGETIESVLDEYYQQKYQTER